MLNNDLVAKQMEKRMAKQHLVIVFSDAGKRQAFSHAWKTMPSAREAFEKVIDPLSEADFLTATTEIDGYVSPIFWTGRSEKQLMAEYPIASARGMSHYFAIPA